MRNILPFRRLGLGEWYQLQLIPPKGAVISHTFQESPFVLVASRTLSPSEQKYALIGERGLVLGVRHNTSVFVWQEIHATNRLQASHDNIGSQE